MQKSIVFVDASWDWFMDEMLPMFGPTMKPSWNQNGIKHRCELRIAIFHKTLFFSYGSISFFEIRWFQVGSQNQPKINQITESKMDCILASIFLVFRLIFGENLEGNMEPRSTQKGIEKRFKKEGQRDCQKSRNKNLQPRAAERVSDPGEGPPLSRRGNPQSHDRAGVGSPPRPKDVWKDPSGTYSL